MDVLKEPDKTVTPGRGTRRRLRIADPRTTLIRRVRLAGATERRDEGKDLHEVLACQRLLSLRKNFLG